VYCSKIAHVKSYNLLFFFEIQNTFHKKIRSIRLELLIKSNFEILRVLRQKNPLESYANSDLTLNIDKTYV